MLRLAFLVSLLCSCACVDFRNITSGIVITDAGGYFDQPYCCVTNTGVFACVITTSPSTESGQYQHMVATQSHDQGKTWMPLVDIEPERFNKPSSFGVPVYSSKLDRLYVVYDYNWQGVDHLPNGQNMSSNSGMGTSFWMRYSDNAGITWSQILYEVPYPITAVDRENVWNGTWRMMWTVDKPLLASDGSVMIAFTKIGTYPEGPPEEIYVLHSANILTEPEAASIKWTMLPAEDHGIQPPVSSLKVTSVVAEEPHLIPLGTGKRLGVLFRTSLGKLGLSYSSNLGQSWTPSINATYAASGMPLKNPRGPTMVRRFSNGHYLLMFYNDAGPNLWKGRNPYWIVPGWLSANGMFVEWGQPEIIIYDGPNSSTLPGYPDFIEVNGRYWITETQKSIARIHAIPLGIFELFWSQWNISKVATDGMLLNVSITMPCQVPMPELPSLLDSGAATISFWFKATNPINGQILLDNRDTKGTGFTVAVTSNLITFYVMQGNLTAVLSAAGNYCQTVWDGALHHVAFIIDGGPKVISVVIDDILCDGGDQPQGWLDFPPDMASIKGGSKLYIMPDFTAGSIISVRIYNRYLFTTEAIGNWRANV